MIRLDIANWATRDLLGDVGMLLLTGLAIAGFVLEAVRAGLGARQLEMPSQEEPGSATAR